MQTMQDLAVALAADVAVGRLRPGEQLPSVRGSARELGCAPGTVGRAYRRLRDAGVVAGGQRSRLTVTADGPVRARALLPGAPVLRLTGSDDPLLDVLLDTVGGDVSLVPGARGSVAGLGVVARGEADATAVHLWHRGTDRYNDDFAHALTVGGPMSLLHLWRREQVLVLPPGNPDSIRSLSDLEGRRLAWRQPGSGSRLLLERLLRANGVTASPDLGVSVDSHLAVAVAVAGGAADAGLAVRAAAQLVGADCLPVAEEPFELAIRTDRLEVAAPVLAALTSPAIRARAAAMPGYDLSAAGALRGVA